MTLLYDQTYPLATPGPVTLVNCAPDTRLLAADPSRLRYVANPRWGSRYSIRCEVRNGDIAVGSNGNRAELSRNELRFNAGDEIWWVNARLLDPTYIVGAAGFIVHRQMHSIPSTGSSPNGAQEDSNTGFRKATIRGGAIAVVGDDAPSDVSHSASGPIQAPNVWYIELWHQIFDPVDGAALTEVWWSDGDTVAAGYDFSDAADYSTTSANIFTLAGQPNQVYPQGGVYRSDRADTTIAYMGPTLIATTKAEVLAPFLSGPYNQPVPLPRPYPAGKFGHTDAPGAATIGPPFGRALKVSRFPLYEPSNPLSLVARMQGDGGSGQQPFRGVIYADNAGLPGALLEVGSEFIVHGSDAEQDYTSTFTGETILPSFDPFTSYWLGVLGGQTTSGTGMIIHATASTPNIVQQIANSATYPLSGDPFGTPSSHVTGDELSVYVNTGRVFAGGTPDSDGTTYADLTMAGVVT